jgi:hypothetical protein
VTLPLLSVVIKVEVIVAGAILVGKPTEFVVWT